ncbi:uncharacterized protein TRIADDRAFT_62272 [Trichoplax adhaerens]|uniref:EGF-like domain-containing protein n=1 Tax=Trichoplax adhaerens TaxID=10228 RepID=B3SDB4_TRIAD|nr:hypothetical protein TRIADDRAFT_62272 [Trichoplax adhaerens]EDV19290.1 hypothetical protein TRIADDRAFT_62272 [Trichoplax adhaerens]|eukprot:XP_002118214.1 hypothetical protein TRIADDRAFT_62272 [Trichoplax adhaerens]
MAANSRLDDKTITKQVTFSVAKVINQSLKLRVFPLTVTVDKILINPSNNRFNNNKFIIELYRKSADYDECISGKTNQCLKDELCVNLLGTYTCRFCQSGYCLNGGTCKIIQERAICVCITPYRGPTCNIEGLRISTSFGIGMISISGVLFLFLMILCVRAYIKILNRRELEKDSEENHHSVRSRVFSSTHTYNKRNKFNFQLTSVKQKSMESSELNLEPIKEIAGRNQDENQVNK